MPVTPIFSILLAAWLGIGGTVGLRFECVCADGTTTVEVGRRFCCESDDGYPMSDERSLLCSHGGCESTLITDGVAVARDRGNESELEPSLLTIQSDLTMIPATHWTPSPSVWSRVYAPSCRATGISQIRTVILLV